MKIKDIKSEIIIKYYVLSLNNIAWIAANTSYVSLTDKFNEAKQFSTFEEAQYYFNTNGLSSYFRIVSVR